MHAHPLLLEYEFGQHSGLNGVFANMDNCPSGRGICWGSRFNIFATPGPIGCPGVTTKFGILQLSVLTGVLLSKLYMADCPLFELAPKKPSTFEYPKLDDILPGMLLEQDIHVFPNITNMIKPIAIIISNLHFIPPTDISMLYIFDR